MARKALLVCGILSPLLYAVADAVAGMGWEAYSFRDQTISELGAIGAPSRPLFTTLLVPTYLLLTAFGVGVWRSASERRGVRVAGILIGALGVLALAVGQFVPMRPRGTEQGLTGALHLVEGLGAMTITVSAIGFAASALGRRFRLYSIVTILLVLGFGAWSGIDAPRLEAGLATPWLGVKERIFWYAYQLWFAVLAVRLLRELPAEEPAGEPEGDEAGRPERDEVRQPVPQVASEDVARIVDRDFPPPDREEVREILSRYSGRSAQGEARVRLGVLKLASGDLGTLHQILEMARADYRDVLLYAEYPRYAEATRDGVDLPPDRRRAVIDGDWAEYREWLGRDCERLA